MCTCDGKEPATHPAEVRRLTSAHFSVLGAARQVHISKGLVRHPTTSLAFRIKDFELRSHRYCCLRLLFTASYCFLYVHITPLCLADAASCRVVLLGLLRVGCSGLEVHKLGPESWRQECRHPGSACLRTRISLNPNPSDL